VPPQEPDEKLGSAVSLRETGVASRPSGQPEMRSDDTGASERKQCRMAYNNGQDAREGEADRMGIGFPWSKDQGKRAEENPAGPD